MGVEAILLLVAGILGLVGLISVGAALAIRRWGQRIVAQWQADGIIIQYGPKIANYRGHASDKIALRGSGIIALTDQAVRVLRWKPQAEFVIPLGQITNLDVQRTWQGSYRGNHPVLVIAYQNGEQADALGVMVRDTEDWFAALTQAAQVAGGQVSGSQRELQESPE